MKWLNYIWTIFFKQNARAVTELIHLQPQTWGSRSISTEHPHKGCGWNNQLLNLPQCNAHTPPVFLILPHSTVKKLKQEQQKGLKLSRCISFLSQGSCCIQMRQAENSRPSHSYPNSFVQQQGLSYLPQLVTGSSSGVIAPGEALCNLHSSPEHCTEA